VLIRVFKVFVLGDLCGWKIKIMYIKNTVLLLIKWLANTPFSNLILNSVPNNAIVDFESSVSCIKKYKCLFLCKLARFSRSDLMIIRSAYYERGGQHLFKMDLNVNEFTQCGYYLSAFDSELLRLLMKGGRVFIDIGANVGFYTLAASKSFDNVYSFEPSPSTFSRLVHNVELNTFGSVTPINSGLSDVKSEMDLHTNPFNNGGASLNGFSEAIKCLYPDYVWGSVKVDVEVLDEIVDSRGIIGVDLIKIDVEGHELAVIRGAQNTIATHRPLVYAEVVKERDKLNAIIAALPNSYIPYSLTDKMLILEDSIIPDDVLFCPAEKLDLLL
jgi:FkbM family methyltransferase